MRGCTLLALASLGAAASTGALAAGDAAKGRQKAVACTVCHGPLGIATAPDAPNLAGQPAAYVVQQLRAFRDATRRHEVMTLMAKPLTDADIDNLGAWFASIKVEAIAP